MTKPAQDSRYTCIKNFANYPLFDDAAPATVQSLLHCATFRTVTEGEQIVDERDDPSEVFFLVVGSCRAYQRLASARQFTPHLLVAPSHFGDLGPLAGAASARFSVDALEPCLVASVPYAKLDTLLTDDHGLCLAWLRNAAGQQCEIIESARQSVFGGGRARLASVFLSFMQVFGRRLDEDSVAIERTLSYQLLADCAGMTRRGVIKTVGQLQAHGALERNEDGWVIKPVELEEYLEAGFLGASQRVTDSTLFGACQTVGRDPSNQGTSRHP